MTDRNTPMPTEPNDDLRERVAQIEEQQQQHEELLEQATDPDGRSWSVSELMTEMGLSRRQALTAVAALAGGATLGGAIRQSIEPAAADASASDGDGDVGLPDNRVDVFADGVDATTVSTVRLGNNHAYASAHGSDGAALQAALNEFGSNPSTVHLDVTTSVGTAAPLTVPDNTVVLIEGDISLANAVDTENLLENKNLQDSVAGINPADNTNIHIKDGGGSLDGNKANQAASSDGTELACVNLIGVQNCSVTGIVAKNSETLGVGISGADNILVDGVYATGNALAGVQSHYLSVESRPNTQGVITDCRVINGGSNGGESAGIYLSGVHDHAVVGNVIEDRDNHGINVAGRNVKTQNVTVANNTIRDVAATTTYYNVRGAINIVTGTNNADTIQNVSITGNSIDNTGATNNSQQGICVFNRGANYIQNFTIANNTIHTQSHGIGVNGTADREVDEFAITDNSIQTTNDIDARGIDLVDAWFGSITGNSIREAQASGIAIRAADSFGGSSIHVTGNWVMNCGQNASATDTHGLWVQDSALTAAFSNVFRNNAGYGISETSNCSDDAFLLNDCRGNSTGATSLNGSGVITDAVGQGTAEDWNIT